MSPAPDDARAPALWRRLASLLYESVVLFGVVMVAGLLYALTTGQRHALHGQLGLRITLFLVLGGYFVWFWTHGGQTLAMRAWRIRLVAQGGRPLTYGRAITRYLACWIWLAPSLAVISWARLTDPVAIVGAVLGGIVGYASLAGLRRDRQFWHDALSGTRQVRDSECPRSPS